MLVVVRPAPFVRCAGTPPRSGGSTRIAEERLAFGVHGVAPVFPDEQNAVHVEVAPALGQRFGDGGVDLHPRMPRSPLAAEIVVADLFDEKRDDIDVRPAVASLPSVTLQEAVDDVFGVGVFVVDGRQRGDSGSVWTPWR